MLLIKLTPLVSTGHSLEVDGAGVLRERRRGSADSWQSPARTHAVVPDKAAPKRRSGQAHQRGPWSVLRGLILALLLAGCASWTNPTKPSSAFADDAAACKAEVAHAALTSGQADLDQDNAYSACLRAKGWELQPHRSGMSPSHSLVPQRSQVEQPTWI